MFKLTDVYCINLILIIIPSSCAAVKAKSYEFLHSFFCIYAGLYKQAVVFLFKT